jgi:hypothetical protein
MKMKKVVYGFEAGDFIANTNWDELIEGDDNPEYSKVDAFFDDLYYYGYITHADMIKCLSFDHDMEEEEFIFGIVLFSTQDDTSDNFIMDALELPLERRYHKIKKSFCDFMKVRYPTLTQVFHPFEHEWNIYVCEEM